jgi:hypothetical protein
MENNELPQVGTILYSSWGYDQTNIDFYKIVKASGKSVWIVPMTKSQNSAWQDAEYVMPDSVVEFQQFRDYETGEIKIVPIVPDRKLWNTKFEGVKLTSFSGAYLWDGKQKLQTHGH